MPPENIDHDTRWKKIIEELFEDFIAFFMPDLYPQIDFSQKPEYQKASKRRKLSKYCNCSIGTVCNELDAFG